jgi:predicted metalloprotease
MEWKGRRQSDNIEDRCGRPPRGAVAATGGLGLLAILAIGWFLGVDVSPLLDDTGLPGGTEVTAADREAGEFVSIVLADTETIWSGFFEAELGRAYTPTTLVLYKGVTPSACSGASGATGRS